MVMWQFFPRACALAFVASASCQLFDTCCDQAVLFSLNLVVPTGRLVFLLIQICNSPMVLYFVNQLTTLETVCTATGRKLCWFCLLWRLTTTYSLSALLFRCLPDHTRHGFQGRFDILPTYDFFKWQVSCTSPTLSFWTPAPIGYPIWILEAIGTACRTERVWLVKLSQQFVSISKSRCSLWAIMN